MGERGPKEKDIGRRENKEDDVIREVWEENLAEEMVLIRDVVEKYPMIAMDTEFPGVVARPVGTFDTATDYHYQTLRCNVDLLKIIQLGLTFSDENGKLASPVHTWQFNFKFSLSDDMYAQDSIDLLLRSGLDFEAHKLHGIDVLDFGALLTMSGMVLMDDVYWISFHSGYDFGYLLKLLTCLPLPEGEDEFFDLLKRFFPNLYDIKFIVKATPGMLPGGLQDLADHLEVKRIGPQHQAGSDALLTSKAFWALKEKVLEGKMDQKTFLGRLYGFSDHGREKK